MPWRETNAVSNRLEFVRLASQPGANKRELCRRFEISPKTGYKWLSRHKVADEVVSLQDRSRRPLRCEQRSAPELEQAVVQLRRQHPAWGGRKIARRLLDLGQASVAPSTVTSILHRHGLIRAEDSEQAAPIQRFEHAQPNALWQMDFKGTFATLAGACYALTMLDDHSRFNLALSANARTTTAHVQPQLQGVFEQYGMPSRINVDNGPPWGAPGAVEHSLTDMGVWLIRNGITLSHSRPRHPQTNGKIERFHRTLKRELLSQQSFADHAQVQRHFDRWRSVYNLQRPHEALRMQTPVQRYRSSPFSFPPRLPSIEYPHGDTVVTVVANGVFKFNARTFRTSRALRGLSVALRPRRDVDGCVDLFFCHQRLATLDLRDKPVET